MLARKHLQVVQNMSPRPPSNSHGTDSAISRFVKTNCTRVVEVSKFNNGISKFDFIAADGYVLATLHLPSDCDPLSMI